AASLTGPQFPGNHMLSHYLHLPFDIFGDGTYALQTAGKSDVVLRLFVDDAGEDHKIRVIPCEIVPASRGV
ncbi:unnamed protein product, partial [marine sediment metagenome]